MNFEQLFEQGLHLFQTGQLQASLKLWQKLQRKCREIGNLCQEAKVLNALGNTYNTLGFHQDALDSHQQQLAITQEINDPIGESKAQSGLGNTYYSLGEHQKAIDCHQKALAIAQNIQDSLGEAIALGNLGNVYCSLGQYLKAIEYHQQALSIFQVKSDRLGEINSLGNLGNAHSCVGEYSKAIEYYEQVLAAFREQEDSYREAIALGNLGNAYYSLGDYKKAMECHQSVLATVRALDDFQGEADSLNNLGNVYYSLGQYREAIECYQQSLILANKIGDRHRQFNSLNNLGNIYDSLGQYPNAIEHHQQSLSIAQAMGNRRGEASALNNIASVYDSLGQYQKAIEYFQLSLAIEREIGNRRGEAQSLSGLGNAYDSLWQFSEAIEYHQQQLSICQEIGDLQGEAHALSGLGNAYHSLGQYSKAIEYHQQSIAIKRELGDRQGESSSLNNLGRAYHFLEQYQLAVNCHQQSLDIAREIGDSRGEGTSLNNLGWTLLHSNQLVEAERKLRQGVERWESLRIGLKDEHNISLFEEQVRIYRNLQKVLVTQGKIAEALEITERGRARAFAELLTRRLTPQSIEQVITTPPNLQKIQQVVQQQNCPIVEYSLLYDYFELEGVPSLRETQLLIWVLQPNSDISFCSVDLKPPSEKQRTSLGSLSDLIVKLYRILNPDIKEKPVSKATNHQEHFNSSISEILKQLYQLLIQPISHLLPTSPDVPVIFIPQDFLFLLPFSTLQDAEGKFLIEKHTILIAPSIQVLELTQKRSIQVPETSLDALVIGNPKMPTIPLTEPPVQLEDLAWAKTEAQVIAHLFKTQAITGVAATKIYIKQQMPKARVIHLATHGLLDDIQQLGVPGAIALAPTTEDNGFLTAGEILEMQLNAQLVVLSACSTGQGKITGDGIIGLSRSLIAAGVNSIIVSLWSVGDQSTAFLMVRFYQNLQQGMKAAVALNKAQRWLLKVTKLEMEAWVEANQNVISHTLRISLHRQINQLLPNDRPFQNPQHWAAFCAIGQ
ncbi:tetratricopeptide repeat protein [Scytonema sp. UIC 10036]|uniref:CHAT domain-containing tetratricopeptide repeat protein n=1 Tax=Scytonema sp. UIC 10036 TaxID=2304196 RepID=UPI0012DADC38|nr:tetratricopeptide repeat protein [Scytonema sp. UIC 10036]MUG94179.1 tetratricopeptide repeat protein [Scytonema sp. UIC 10036]